VRPEESGSIQESGARIQEGERGMGAKRHKRRKKGEGDCSSSSLRLGGPPKAGKLGVSRFLCPFLFTQRRKRDQGWGVFCLTQRTQRRKAWPPWRRREGEGEGEGGEKRGHHGG